MIATEDFNYIGRHSYMIRPRVFCETPYSIFGSHRTKYREDYFRMHLSDEEFESYYSIGSENDFNITKNGCYLFKYNNCFNEGF